MNLKYIQPEKRFNYIMKNINNDASFLNIENILSSKYDILCNIDQYKILFGYIKEPEIMKKIIKHIIVNKYIPLQDSGRFLGNKLSATQFKYTYMSVMLDALTSLNIKDAYIFFNFFEKRLALKTIFDVIYSPSQYAILFDHDVHVEGKRAIRKGLDALLKSKKGIDLLEFMQQCPTYSDSTFVIHSLIDIFSDEQQRAWFLSSYLVKYLDTIPDHLFIDLYNLYRKEKWPIKYEQRAHKINFEYKVMYWLDDIFKINNIFEKGNSDD